MLELRSPTGALNFNLVTDEVIAGLDPTAQEALLNLMKANEQKEACILRRSVATGRVATAIDDDECKRVTFEDSNSPIPFSTTMMEEALGRPLNAGEMAAAREQHAIRVRGLLQQRAHQASIAAYNASH